MSANQALGTALPTADHIVSEVVRRWPQTVRVFLRRRMACVGCSVAPYVTIAEAARSYACHVDTLVAELQASIARPLEEDET